MKKLVPKRRFAGFIKPWEKLKFGEIFFKLQNNSLSRARLNYDKGEVYNVHYGDILINYGECLDVNEEHLPFINTGISVENYRTSFLKNGDIIFADAAEDETVGKCSEIQGITREMIISGLHTIPCRPKQEFRKGYLGYYLNSDAYHKQLLPLMQGTKVLSISMPTLNETKVVFPSKEEQEKIGNFFSTLDKLISLNQTNLDKLKASKSAYLAEMFPQEGELYPKRRFAGFTEPWEKRRLGDMGKTYSGLTGKTKEDFGHGEAEFVTYLNVFNNLISDERQTENVEMDDKQDEVQFGDVFFTTSSETPEEVGMSSVWLGSKPNIYLNSFCFGFRPTKKINPYFMAYMLRSPEVRRCIQILAQGISRYNISKTKVMEISVFLPVTKEQEKIGEFFSNLDSLITAQANKLEKLQALKKAYLEEMFV